MPPGMLGKAILEKQGKSEANEAVLQELRARDALLRQENYHHSYPHCWRSKTPIIFRAMDQWFIEIDHVAPAHALPRPAVSASASRGNRPRDWVPDWGKSRIEAAVKGRPDWCISRQRTWGVPIPAFYDGRATRSSTPGSCAMPPTSSSNTARMCGSRNPPPNFGRRLKPAVAGAGSGRQIERHAGRLD